MSHIDSAVATIAESQFGVFSLDQVLACGGTYKMVDARVANGRWRRLGPRVFAIAGAPRTWHGDLTALILAMGPGSAAGFRSAAAAYGLHAFRATMLEVVSPTRRTPILDGIAHYSRRLDQLEIRRESGLVVTTPARTLLDLGAVAPVPRVGIAFDSALRRNLVTIPEMRDKLAWAGKGYPGARTLRILLAQRPDGYVAPASRLERKLKPLLERAGLPSPVREHPVHLQRATYYLDLAYPELKIGIEADGYAFHLGREEKTYDDIRNNRLTVAGWAMLHNCEWRIENDQRELVDEVIELYAARSALLRA